MSLDRTYFLKLVRNLLSFTPSIAHRIIVKTHTKIHAYWFVKNAVHKRHRWASDKFHYCYIKKKCVVNSEILPVTSLSKIMIHLIPDKVDKNDYQAILSCGEALLIV